MLWSLENTADTSAGPVHWSQTGSGSALILAHGWPWSSWSWHRVIPRLAEDFTVYWYDMPGFGRSIGGSDMPTGLDMQGRVFAEMIAHWQLERPAVWAHDFGGAVSLRARLLHGASLGPHLLMNVVAMRPWGSEFFDHVGRHIDAFLGLPPHIHAAVVEAYIKGALVCDLGSDTVSELVAPWLGRAGQSAFYAQFAQADERFTAEVEPHYGSLDGPARVLWGEDDPWIPIQRGRALAETIGCDFKTLPGVGHLAQLEDPDLAVDAALSFFSEVT